MLVQNERSQQANANENEFASLAMSFFGSFPLNDAVEFVQLATTKELSDFLEDCETMDLEFIPDGVMEITMQGQQLVNFFTRTYDLMNKILKQQNNGESTLPAEPTARA